MRDISKLLIGTIIIVVFGVIGYFMLNTIDIEMEQVTFKISNKTMEEKIVGNPYVWFDVDYYYFGMENGDTIKVDEYIFDSYEIGDEYSYWKWKE